MAAVWGEDGADVPGWGDAVRIACVGGGPSGLYFALLMRLGGPGREVTVFERGVPGATRGWGVDDLSRYAGLGPHQFFSLLHARRSPLLPHR